jgi:chromate transport protein ChrA
MIYLNIIINNIIIAITAHGGGTAFLPLFKDQYISSISQATLEQMIYVVSSLPGPISVELSGIIGFYLTNSIIGMIISIFSYIFIPILVTYFASEKLLNLSKKKAYQFFTNNVMAIIFAGILILLGNMVVNLTKKYETLTSSLIILLVIINYFQIKRKIKNQYILLINIFVVSGYILMKGTI